MRKGSGKIALAAVCFGVGVLFCSLFPPCAVLIVTALLLIVVGLIVFRC